MAIEIIDGFDDWTTFDTWYRSHTYITIEAPGRFGYGRRMAFSTHNIYAQRSVPTASRYTAAFAWQPYLSTVTSCFFMFLEGTAIHGYLYVVNGQLRVQVAGGTYTTTTLAITSEVWYHIEFDLDVHDSTGSFSLKLNGATVLEQSSIDTKNGGSGIIDNIRFFSTNITGGYSQYDDLILRSGGGSIGDCRVYTDYPSANGSNTEWDIEPAPAPVSAFAAIGIAVANANAVAVSWPAGGYSVGDIGLLFIETEGGEICTIPSDWTLLGTSSTHDLGAGEVGTRVSVWWKRATSTSMGNVTMGDSGDHQYGVIVVVSGVAKNGDPVDVIATGSKGDAGTTLTIGGLTTSQDGELVVLAASTDNDSTTAWASSWTNANLTDLTERFDGSTSQDNGGGLAIATGTKTTAGAIGDTTATVVANENAYIAIAFKPATTAAFAAVNDEVPNGDDDYISTETTDERATFEFPSISASGDVVAVAVSHVSRKDDAGDRTVATVIRDDTTDYDNATAQTLAETYAPQSQIYEEDPSTEAAWTLSGVNAREYGIKLVS